MKFSKSFVIGIISGAATTSGVFLFGEKSVDVELPLNSTDGIDFVTNLSAYEYRIEEPERTTKYAGPILYKTHLAYSTYFAESYGFPSEYVSDELPNFIDYMAMDVKYAGNFSSCRMKMLLDKNGPVRLPEYDIYEPTLNLMRSALPERSKGTKEKQYQQNYRINDSGYLSNNEYIRQVHNTFSLAGLENKSDPNGPRSNFTTTIEVLKWRLFKEWVYVEISSHCGALLKNTFNHNWVYVLASSRSEGTQVLPILTNFDKVVKIPVPTAFKNAVSDDLERINFE